MRRALSPQEIAAGSGSKLLPVLPRRDLRALRAAEDVELDAVADMVSTAIGGGMALGRATGNSAVLPEQILMVRTYVKLLLRAPSAALVATPDASCQRAAPAPPARQEDGRRSVVAHADGVRRTASDALLWVLERHWASFTRVA